MTNAESPMNAVLRGRGRTVPNGQANANADADPLAEARAIAGELAGSVDTLRKLLAKAEAADANPFAKGS